MKLGLNVQRCRATYRSMNRCIYIAEVTCTMLIGRALLFISSCTEINVHKYYTQQRPLIPGSGRYTRRKASSLQFPPFPITEYIRLVDYWLNLTSYLNYFFAMYCYSTNMEKKTKLNATLRRKIYRTIEATTTTVNEVPVMQALQKTARNSRSIAECCINTQ